MGVALRFSSIASCADTLGGRVESPIRPFFTQHSALWKGYREDGTAFPTYSCCLPPRYVQTSPRGF